MTDTATTRVPATTTDMTNATIRAAAEAMSVWSSTSRAERSTILRSLASELAASSDDLVPVTDAETGLGTGRLVGELARTVHQLRMFADVVDEGAYLEVTIDHADPAAPVPIAGDVRRWLVPLGPVAVYSASNFPLAFSVLGGDTASALAAGCTVVVKAHQGHPRTSELVHEIAARVFREAGMPEGVLGLVHGRDAGRTLICHPEISAAGFTGSVSGGRALADLAHDRPHPIPFFGELGSQNTLVISPGAAETRGADIAEGLATSVLLGSGQFCTKPGLVLLPNSASGQRILEHLADSIRTASVSRLLTTAIQDGFISGSRELEASAGINLIARGDSAAVDGLAPALWECAPEHLDGVALEECFGPTAVVVRYGDEDELLGLVRKVRPALTASFHTETSEQSLSKALLETLTPKAGRVVANQYPTGVAVTWSMHHGGPSPSTTDSQHTSVGATAIRRFLRPVAFQNVDPALLPDELQDTTELAVPRRVDGVLIS
ncbi:aldehyde dehydrogenase (NADP(+)) [Rhodococcus opacus]|nr:aldehyde dehydrogenase (NADP(+)) [Rhodococcus opacus]